MKPRKSKKSYFSLPWRLLKRYLANCSIHGVKYLVQEDCHWSERLFWFICCALSWYGCTRMVSGVLSEFSKRQVATTVDTNHLHWEPGLPSLYFCTQLVPESKKYIAENWNKGAVGKSFMVQIGLVANIPQPHDSKVFEELLNLSSLKCDSMFVRCIWNDKDFDCCKIILPLHTPVGPCLVFNSILTSSKDGPDFIKRDDDTGILDIHLNFDPKFKKFKNYIDLYIFQRAELPTILSDTDKKLPAKWTASETQIDITQVPTYNEAGVRNVPVPERYCRFVDEAEDMQIFKSYSHGICVTEYIVKRMLDWCGCVSHVYPRNDEMPICNYTGLVCLNSTYPDLIDSHDIPCVSACDETTFQAHVNFLKEKTHPIIRVNLLPGPTFRNRRFIVHSKLDLVVAVGSAIGLFVGASILSLVEIPYWFIVRGIDDEDDDESR